MARRRTHRGFTLVEMLVVIAIIGVLVALLLPAVQMAREASRRAKCSNQLRQLALAVQQFEQARGRLPYNQFGAPFGGEFEDSSSWSWLSAILPYLELQNTYNVFLPHIEQKPGAFDPTQNKTLAAGITAMKSQGTGNVSQAGAGLNVVPVFYCPSDFLIGTKSFAEHTRYMRGGLLEVGLTNYKGVQGANFPTGGYANPSTLGGSPDPWLEGDGVFYPMDWQKKRSFSNAVRDGLTNTFMIGEDTLYVGAPTAVHRGRCHDPLANPPAASPQIGLGFAWAHSVEACATGNFPPNLVLPPLPDGTPVPDCTWEAYNGFRSRHPNGVQFARCDASVVFVSNTVDLRVYRAQCTVDGYKRTKDPNEAIQYNP